MEITLEEKTAEYIPAIGIPKISLHDWNKLVEN